jgi:hypothetical protein
MADAQASPVGYISVRNPQTNRIEIVTLTEGDLRRWQNETGNL